MRLTTSLKKANPFETPHEISSRARAELRGFGGEPSHRRLPRARWLAPSLVVVLVLAGVGLGLSRHESPYAFADEITATVMPSQITPIPLGTSLIFDIPYSSSSGMPETHAVRRAWLASDGGASVRWTGWTQIPDTITFTLQVTADDIGFYHAENWPFEQIYQVVIVGPGSSRCQGGEFPDVDVPGDTIMAQTRIFLCDYALAKASPDYYDLPELDKLQIYNGGYSAPVGSIQVEIYGVTRDSEHLIAQLKQFELGAEGWLSVPEEYANWAQQETAQITLPQGPCGGPATPLPEPGLLDPGFYCFAVPDREEGVAIGVRGDGGCVVKRGEEFLSLVGITLNQDETCAYTP